VSRSHSYILLTSRKSSNFPHDLTRTGIPNTESTVYVNRFDQADHPKLWEQEAQVKKLPENSKAKNLSDLVEPIKDPYTDKQSQYETVWEPTLPRMPDLSKGELASGANVVRTDVWKDPNEPAIVSISKFTPDNFRPIGYAENAPNPDSINPEGKPDFRDYRLPLGHADRRPFYYTISAGFFVTTAAMIRSIVCKAVHTLWISKDTVAAGTVEVDLTPVAEGEQIVVKWRGKPVFVRHRTPEQIDRARKEDGDFALLKDPEFDTDRCPKPEWLVCIGVCTHLGCIPTDGGNYNGFFCPCHGSHYDISGRIRLGPAPSNLEVPPYVFKDDSTIVLG